MSRTETQTAFESYRLILCNTSCTWSIKERRHLPAFPVEVVACRAGRQLGNTNNLLPVVGWRHNFYGNRQFSPLTSVPIPVLGKERAICIFKTQLSFYRTTQTILQQSYIWQHKLYQPFVKVMAKYVRLSRLITEQDLFRCTSTFCLFIKECHNPQGLMWRVKKTQWSYTIAGIVNICSSETRDHEELSAFAYRKLKRK